MAIQSLWFLTAAGNKHLWIATPSALNDGKRGAGLRLAMTEAGKCRYFGPSELSGLSQIAGHEEAVRIRRVVGEWGALNETVTPVKCHGRLEIVRHAGFQT